MEKRPLNGCSLIAAVEVIAYKCTASAQQTFDVLLQYVVDDGIDVLVHVLEKERKAVLDSELQLLQKVRVVKRAHLAQRRLY